METEKLYQNKEWLRGKYWDEELNTYQIGKICKVHNKTIWRWLKELGISIRNNSEAKSLSKTNHCNPSQEAIEWINGELLGDGCLQSRSPYSASFTYTSKYLEYINYISNTLKSFGIEQSGKIAKYHDKRYNVYFYCYCSRSYAELLPIRKQWYPKGIKIIPKDIELTFLICRQWYLGDGNLHHEKKGRPCNILNTCGFSVSGVNWLVKQLIKLGFKATRRPGCNTIRISAYSTKVFLDYIGNSPVKCYNYKFEY